MGNIQAKPIMNTENQKTHINPYIGPRTFKKDEEKLFFGRDREARDLTALVASEKLVLFYAQSGAGKSSLINTRLIPELEKRNFEVLPIARVSGHIAQEVEGGDIYLYNLYRSLLSHDMDAKLLSSLSLSQFLDKLNEDDKGYFFDESLTTSVRSNPDIVPWPRVLIIDQFEELYSTNTDAWRMREDFFCQLAEAMEKDHYLWIVLVMREDYIATLDPYCHLLPGGLRARYYMQRLSHEAAIQAVKNPVKSLRPYAEDVAEKLVEDLSRIKVQKPDGTLDFEPGQYIEPVQLQVVCYSLWEGLSEGNEITEKDLQEVGDVNQSLGKYYERRVKEVSKNKNVEERLIREWIEKKLIAAGGIRSMVIQQREAKPGELADNVIQALQSDLVRAETRGGVTWYELTHDRLVEPILENNRKWDLENSSPFRSQVNKWEKSEGEDKKQYLISGQILITAQQWAASNPDKLIDTERKFLEASQDKQNEEEKAHEFQRQQEEHERQIQQEKLDAAENLARERERFAQEQARSARIARTGTVIALIFLVVAVATAIYAVQRTNEATQSKNVAETAQAVAVTAQAEAQDSANSSRANELSAIALDRSGSQMDLAILLGLQADAIKRNDRTQNTLLALLQKSSRFRGLVNQEDSIEEIQYSPDGKSFALRDRNGITFRDAATLNAISKPMNGHFSNITSLALSNDKSLMASGAQDGTIVIWDVNGKKVRSLPFKAQNGPVSSLAFNTENTLLASASSGETAIHLWDISDPTNPKSDGVPLNQHTQAILSLAFNPQGNILASGGYDHDIILWDVEQHKQLGKSLSEHQDWVNDLVFNSDGTYLISAGDDYRAILWELKENPAQTNKKEIPIQAIKVAELPNSSYTYVRSVALSPDQNLVAMGSSDGSIILWNIKDHKNPIKLSEISPEGSSTTSKLAFSPKGDVLVSGISYNGDISLWNIKNAANPTKLSKISLKASSYISNLFFIDDGDTLVVGGPGSAILFWDVSQPKTPKRSGAPLEGHPGKPTSMQFSPDGSLLASKGDDGTILLNALTHEQIGRGDFYSSSNGQVVAYQVTDMRSGDNTIYLKKNGNLIGEEIAGQSPVISPNGTSLAYSKFDKDGQLQLYLRKITTNPDEKEVAFKNGQFPVFSPNSQILAYQTLDPDTSQTSLTIWDVTHGKTIGEKIYGSFQAFSPDSKLLLYQTIETGTGLGMLNILEISTSEYLARDMKGSYLAFNPDSKILIYQLNNSMTGENQVKLWKIEDAKELQSYSIPYPTISQNGSILAFVSSDENGSTINLINTETGEKIATVQGNSITSLSANGKILLYSAVDSSGTSSINAVITDTGKELLSNIINASINRFLEAGKTLVVEVYDYISGKTSFVLFDTTSGQQIGDKTEGSYSYLSEDGNLLVYEKTGSDGTKVNLLDVPTNTRLGEPINGNFMAVSQDGKTLVARSEGSTAIFWDVTKTWPFGELMPSVPGTVQNASVSQDGKTMAWVDEKGVSIQELSQNTLVGKPFMNHHGSASSAGASFSPDGKIIAVENYDENSTTLWDIKTGEQIGKSIEGILATFSPDSKTLIVTTSDESGVNIYDISDPKSPAQVGGPIPGYLSAFSPDGNFVSIGGDSQSGNLALWGVKEKKIIDNSLPGDYGAFSPDSKLLAVITPSSSSENTTIYDLATFQPVGKPMPGGGFAVFNPDGKSIAVANSDGLTTLWDLTTRSPIGDPIEGGLPLEFSPDGRLLLFADENLTAFQIWDMIDRKQVGEDISASSSYSGPFSFPYVGSSADGQVFAFVDDEGKVQLYDAETEQYLPTPEYPGEIIGANLNQNGLFLSQNNHMSSANTDLLAILGSQGLMFWDVKENKMSGEFPAISLAPLTPASDVVLSWDGKLAATYAEDGIVLRNIVNGKDTSLNYAGQLTDNMIFNSDSTRLTALADDNTLVSWDLPTGDPVELENQPLKGMNIQRSVFSPGGKYLAYLVNNNNNYSLYIWDFSNEKMYIDPYIPLNGYGGAIAFSADENLIAYNDGGKINVYDLPHKTRMPGTIATGLSGITGLNLITDDGRLKYIISADSSGSNQMWYWDTGTKIGDPISGKLKFIGATDEGHRLIYIDSSGKLIGWNWDLDHSDWKKLLCQMAKRNFTESEWKIYFPKNKYPQNELMTCPVGE
jgi:WD40 repeat protein